MIEDSAGPVIVLTALDLEYQAIRAHLTEPRQRVHPAGTLFETGRLAGGGGGGPITIAVTGEGNPGAAVLAERAIAMFNPRALLLVGVAGALKDDISLGDVVVATRVYGYHGGKDASEGFLIRPRAWDAPHELEQLARHIARTGSWTGRLAAGQERRRPAVHFKPIAAGEVLLSSSDAALAGQLRQHYNDAVAVEMESAGISQASHLNRSLPVLTIRGISDKADRAKHAADQAGWQRAAAAHAAAFAVELAASLTADDAPEGAAGDGRDEARQGHQGARAPAAGTEGTTDGTEGTTAGTEGAVIVGGDNRGIISTGDHAINAVSQRCGR